MAAHHISLAKASFGASLLRPDVTKVSRDDLPTFHNAFEATLHQCSSRNIQTCKQWLLENVVVSTTRTTALGKYLVAIARHLTNQPDESSSTRVSRQRLHILYLVNDLLHHARYHEADVALCNNLTQSLQPFLADLIRLSASDAKAHVRRRLSDLIQLWKEEEYFSPQVIDEMHDALAGVASKAQPTVEHEAGRKSADKELPYLIPATHGDPSLPFYDLPAGNLMRHIIPNSSQPMRPDEVRALQFSAGPADESLVNALKDFLNDVKGAESTLPRLEQSGLSPEIDEMGQISYHDETGDVVGQEARVAVEVQHLRSADVVVFQPTGAPDHQGRIAAHLPHAGLTTRGDNGVEVEAGRAPEAARTLPAVIIRDLGSLQDLTHHQHTLMQTLRRFLHLRLW
ncbi:hypothetical protein AYO20_02542 [Fonsecaea nubica]|uniref:CID domain-containing protein n=1 Tax=Fonsecaea nubica TaxID=856822 RepID=A0A178D786_9EURO|nr:hypothetical protein AYO20_02542 [Fonsecaea nubica]OAL38090.1 hypothetical protein AYO20_02542 [Fonsecaea nubica]